MSTEWITAALVPAALFAVAGLVLLSRASRTVKLLVLVALCLRLVGATAQFLVLTRYYRIGDAIGYYTMGLHYADLLRQGNLSWALDSYQWWGGTWIGTQFIYYPSALVLAVIGPTFLGECIVFSLFAFLGLSAFAVAFRRAYPAVPFVRYARWVWLFPSLWFWTSSVGKEAVIMLGLGMAILGYIGRRERTNWLLLLPGVFIVFAVRPQFAAVLVACLVAGRWLSFRKWTVSRMAQAVVILFVGLLAIQYSLRTVGVGGLDVEEVQSYIESEPARDVGGHSAIAPVQLSPAAAPAAVANILFRPFPWEIHNPMMAFSSLEIVLLWVVLFRRRRQVAHALWHWRSDRFLRIALPFAVAYTLSLGYLLTNLGLIARQRIFLFPFLFVLLEGVRPSPAAVENAVEIDGNRLEPQAASST